MFWEEGIRVFFRIFLNVRIIFFEYFRILWDTLEYVAEYAIKNGIPTGISSG